MQTIKVIEIIGSSPTSWQEAAENGLQQASKTVENIVGIEAISWTAKVSGGKVTEYHTTVKIAFVVKD